MSQVATAATPSAERVLAAPAMTIVIPTYNERDNIEPLVRRILAAMDAGSIPVEVLVVDDDSPDGTGQIADSLRANDTRVTVLHRKDRRGLSSALLDGFAAARSDVVCAMDADGSHPVEVLPRMVERIADGADLVIGSRYVKGGSTEGWPLKRRMISRGATVLARPFTHVKDPMSGFFAVRRKCLEGVDIKARGYKIGLEILVRANYDRVEEVPIRFVDREKGNSKLKFSDYAFFVADVLDYLGATGQWLRFMTVGAIGGTFYFLIIYALTQWASLSYVAAGAIAFTFAVTHNYVLNKVWTFREAFSDHVASKYTRFFALALVALGVNVGALYLLTDRIGGMPATVVAILAASIVNYLGSRWWTFVPEK